jgi:hypothetical protein
MAPVYHSLIHHFVRSDRLPASLTPPKTHPSSDAVGLVLLLVILL